MRRRWNWLAVFGVSALAVAGAFALLRDETISVEAARDAARDQGFDAVIWRASAETREQAEEIAKAREEPVRISGDGRIVILRGRKITDLKQPVMIVWFPADDPAAKYVEANRPLFEGRLSADEQAVLPRDFDVRRLSEHRICNLVVTSYDDGSDSSLEGRIKAFVDALRKRC